MDRTDFQIKLIKEMEKHPNFIIFDTLFNLGVDRHFKIVLTECVLIENDNDTFIVSE